VGELSFSNTGSALPKGLEKTDQVPNPVVTGVADKFTGLNKQAEKSGPALAIVGWLVTRMVTEEAD
jgi:hypothetical protein